MSNVLKRNWPVLTLTVLYGVILIGLTAAIGLALIVHPFQFAP